jgi:hypothetical protein
VILFFRNRSIRDSLVNAFEDPLLSGMGLIMLNFLVLSLAVFGLKRFILPAGFIFYPLMFYLIAASVSGIRSIAVIEHTDP